MPAICPMPVPWNDAYQELREASEQSAESVSPPPVPLILNGWSFSSDGEKAQRWLDTIAWAEKCGFQSVLKRIPLESMYCG